MTSKSLARVKQTCPITVEAWLGTDTVNAIVVEGELEVHAVAPNVTPAAVEHKIGITKQRATHKFEAE